MRRLLSKDGLSVHLNKSLGSACKLSSLEIQTVIIDSVLQEFRKQFILEFSQTDYPAVISHKIQT